MNDITLAISIVVPLVMGLAIYLQYLEIQSLKRKNKELGLDNHYLQNTIIALTQVDKMGFSETMDLLERK